MIYETVVLAQAETNDEQLASIKAIVTSVLSDFHGEILVDEDWGVKSLAQLTENKIRRGRYLYFMYKSAEGSNAEIDRRFRINESIIRSMIIKMGDDKEKEDILKAYKSPFARN